MPILPYEMEALSPKMSKETLDYHYGKHLQTYVNNLNKLTAGTEFSEMTLEDIIKNSQGPIYNNAAQTWNHTFFFESLSPVETEIPEKLTDKIKEGFTSVENFKEEFKKSALGLFGSGWSWLIEDENKKLKIINTNNAGNPLNDNLTPLMVIDVWEHAYYIDYRNNRGTYIDSVISITNWKKVSERLK